MDVLLKWGGIVMAFLVAVSCGEPENTVPAAVVRPVKYEVVKTPDHQTVRSFPGVSKAGSTSRVSFRVNGKIETLLVREGDKIQKHARIATLDDSDARLQYEKAQSALNKSKVYMDTARSNLGRIKGLYENNNVSLNDYEAAKEKLANSKADYMADKKNLDLQKKELGYFTLAAPVTGMISGVLAERGENVSAGQVILEIHTIDEMEVLAGIPDAYISGVKKDAEVRVVFGSVGDQAFRGRITKVSYNIDTESSTYPVTVRIDTPSDAIRPGMPATLSFTFSKQNDKDLLTVPVHAVGQDNTGHFLYLVTKTDPGRGVVAKTYIKIGKMTNNGFEVAQGIKTGDMVVTAGISHLSDGLEVKMP